MSALIWDEARIHEVQRLWNDGWTEPEIAAHFGTTRQAVHAARDYHGLVEPRERGHAPFRRLPKKPLPPIVTPCPAAPGWPTKAQLMARR